jgi:hydroxymethylbilane synthase
MTQDLVLATRRSRLALAQARAWTEILTSHHSRLRVRELHVTTTGDRVQDRALQSIGGKGLFIKEVEEALLAGTADLAVHSMKDVPAQLAASLVIGCVPVREDPRDVAVTRTGCSLAELEPGARVGTSSLRRRVQLHAWRPDLEYVPLRGNVDTRLRRCAEGVVDAVILARAGLARLGLLDQVCDLLDPELCLPAAGQGALAIEHREADDRVRALLEPLTDEDTAVQVAAERGVLFAVQGNCQIPVAALAVRRGAELLLRGMLAEPDGSKLRRARRRMRWPGDQTEAHDAGLDLGRELASLG